MEALATLYPDCSGQSLSVVTCHKVAHNIGIVRVAVYVLVPMLVSMFVRRYPSRPVHNPYCSRIARFRPRRLRQTRGRRR